MAEHIVVLVITGVALFAKHATRLRQSNRREKWILISFGVPILYLSCMFATNNHWVNLHDLANQSIGRIAHFLVEWLKQHP
jgi:hypothetical protein